MRSHSPVSSSRRSSSMPLKSSRDTIPTPPTVIDNGHRAIASVFHQPQRFDCDLSRWDRVGLPCHHLAQCRVGGVFSLCQHPVHGIAACKDADKATVALSYEDGTDAAVAHALACLSYRCTRWKSDRVLVPHEIGHLSHLSGPLLRKSLRLRSVGFQHFRWSMRFLRNIYRLQFDQGSMNFPITDTFELGKLLSLLLQTPVQPWKPI